VIGDHIALSCAAAAKSLDRTHGAFTTFPDELGEDSRDDAGGREYVVAIDIFGKGRLGAKDGMGG